MARWDPVAWLQNVLEKELVVTEPVGSAEEKPKVIRARDVGLADVRILRPTPLERAADPQLRAVVSLRLIFPRIEDGRVVGYDVSEAEFPNIHIRESASHPGYLYLRYPSLRQIVFYEVVERRNKFGEPYQATRAICAYRQGYGLTPRQRDFLLAAYRHLRDINGWERCDVEEVPQPKAAARA